MSSDMCARLCWISPSLHHCPRCKRLPMATGERSLFYKVDACVQIFNIAQLIIQYTAIMARTLLLINLKRIANVPLKKEWLAQSVAGPYTTMRTIDGNRIVELNMHIHRLVTSVGSLLTQIRENRDPFHRELPALEAEGTLTDTDRFTSVFKQHVRAALEEFHNTTPPWSETRITVLVNWGHMYYNNKRNDIVDETAGFNMGVYVEELPALPKPPVDVMLRLAPSSMNTAEGKDSKWIEQRKYLEDEKGDCNEVVLLDSKGRALEGTQTNFLAVVDGVLRTASAKEVLPGTIRNIVLDVCHQQGIPIKEEAPTVAELHRWSGACVMSTSRLALPIQKLVVHPELACFDGITVGEHALPQCDVMDRVVQLVQDHIRDHSGALYEDS
eukprot:TRINITY_DN11298_c0_g1_i11.p1 TRINITY_DN11298_c0_g1~~TRINITY_DN11298_c0_g1_i11.p1  ORF type:complete len:385 (+),score=46.27 TRINITY_DN11298_c0_g1_i11:1022-2176(+)